MNSREARAAVEVAINEADRDARTSGTAGRRIMDVPTQYEGELEQSFISRAIRSASYNQRLRTAWNRVPRSGKRIERGGSLVR